MMLPASTFTLLPVSHRDKRSERASPVIFGEKGDTPLLDMVSLEALGYILDPLRRELRPLPMVLG